MNKGEASPDLSSGRDPVEKETNQHLPVVRDGLKNIRDTAKMIAGGAGAAGAAIIVSTPLTGIGQIDSSWRVIFAILGAGVGLSGLGFIIWSAVEVIAPRILIPSAFTKGAISSKCRKHIENELKPLFPKGFPTFQEIAAECEKLEDIRKGDDTQKAEEATKALKSLDSKARTLDTYAVFEAVRYSFLGLRKSLLYFVPLTALGVGVFAWAVNPPKEEAYVLPRPLIATVELHPRDAAVATSQMGVSEACVQNTLRVLILAVHSSGIKEAVSVPTETCPAVRLRVLGEKVVLPK